MLDILCQIGENALIVNLLTGMKKELETRGWGQRSFKSKATGKVCLVGSAYSYLNYSFLDGKINWGVEDPWVLVYDILRTYLPNTINTIGIITNWNDERNRTKEDVINLLDKAIADRGGFV